MSKKRPHIFIHESSTRESYQPKGTGGGNGKDGPKRKRKEHSEKLVEELQKAWEEAQRKKAQRSAIGMGTADGVCLQFRSDPDFELALDSLDLRSQGIELLSVHNEAGSQIAAVYIPDEKIATFLKKFQDYAQEDDRWGKPKNRTLVESIAELKIATLRSLWTDERALFPANDQESIWWEVWLRDPSTPDGFTDAVLNKFRDFANNAGIIVKQDVVRFLDRTVLLARANRGSLAASIDVLADIAEVRLAKESPIFFTGLRNTDQATWANDLAERIEWPPEDAPAVCLLDTGVNREHILLERALSDNDCHTWEKTWGTADRNGHGTEMAGVALFGDLQPALETNSSVQLEHRLESVKILRHPNDNIDPQLYGAIVSTAISSAEVESPARSRVFAMAVTGPDNRDRGKPSSWSAEIDALAAGVGSEQAVKRLIVISAGNSQNAPSKQYMNDAMTEGIYDPGQSWNALTVGAYTRKHHISETVFAGWSPLANPGDLTPGTSTSVLWTNSAWPIKPDCVLEGGNMVVSPEGNTDYAASLETLTTAHQPFLHHFTTTGQTSAASSEAARMAAIIMSQYPQAWPETVRGLIVHSSRWSKAMLDRFGTSNNSQIENLLRCYGYGVPQMKRALESAANALTLIAQDHIFPFEADTTKEMALHKIPWPKRILEEMGETPVRLRITLSYFIEPNPARRGWTTRHRYASHGLRFDVKTPTESVEDFRKRINKQALAEGEKSQTKSDSSDWLIGPTLRHKGSIHSDVWQGTAAKLAERSYIAVYPVIGWWRERHQLGQWKDGARYSLLVSIETPRTDIDLYVPVANLVGITTEI